MIQLATSYSSSLSDLLESKQVTIDAIEVGTYFNPPQIRQIRERFADYPFYFHTPRLIPPGFGFKRAVRRWQEYLAATSSSWISFHMVLVPPLILQLALRFKIYLPLRHSITALERFCDQVNQMAKAIQTPILLENMPNPPHQPPPFRLEIDPERITQMLDRTRCNLLLDLAHARIAAQLLGWNVEDYLTQLPLSKVKEIHVSGPRKKNGYWVDAHEPMQEVDYALLEWVLARTQPDLLMLEYYRDRDALREQLVRLRTMLDTSLIA